MKEFSGRKGVFCFRIDLDFFHPEHVMKTLEVAERHEIRMTWFVTMETGRFHADEIKRIAETQDVQNHGFLHETFAEEETNFENIMKAHEALASAGVECSGFAAPFGHWNQALGKALEKTGYAYSSEFREGESVFPFYPRLGKRKAKVLQAPVHPVCLGNLLESGYNAKESIDYFDRIIGLMYEKQAPIFLYGHPDGRLGKYPEVLDSIFSRAKELDDLWFTTLTDYARFWKRKGFGERKTAFDHDAFLERKTGFPRKVAGFYRGQLHRIDKKKVSRRLHR